MEPRQAIGHEIKQKRLELEWSEGQLATRVNEAIRDEKKVYEGKDVQDWEMHNRLPDKNEVEALIQVLIRQNDQVADKTGAEREFRGTYAKTCDAFAAGTLKIGDSHIGHVIRKLRGPKSEAELAHEVSTHIVIVPDRSEITKYDIAKLEEGDLYDKQVFGAMLKVHKAEGKLTEGEVEQLQKRYAQLEKPSDARSALIPSDPARNLYEAHERLVDYLGDDAQEFMKSSIDVVKYVKISDRAKVGNTIIGGAFRKQEKFDVARVTDFLQELERRTEGYLALEKEMMTVLKQTVPVLSSSLTRLDEVGGVPYSLGNDGNSMTLDPEKLRKEVNRCITDSKCTPGEETDRAIDKIIALKQQLLAETSPPGPARVQLR